MTLPSADYMYEKQTRIGIFGFQILIILYFILCMNSITFWGPTLDDSWIHYQYVKNLAEHGEVAFNAGEWSTGTTSILWDLLLIPGYKLGIPIVPLSLGLGIILFLILGQQIYAIFRTFWKDELNNTLSIAIVLLTGNMTWYALSGMETLLFLVLGCWWIQVFQKEKWWLAGIIAGLLMLTRIEGLLFFLMGIFFCWKKLFGRGNYLKPILVQIACGIPLTLPSFILNKFVTGKFYPTTMAGKKWLYSIDPGFLSLSVANVKRYVLSWIATFYQTNWWPQMIDRPSTIQYPIIRLITKGRIDKTAPEFGLEPYPMWFQALTILVGIILFLVLLRGMYRLLRPLVKNLLNKREVQSWELLLYWFIGQNLIYILLMPHRGHGGRYQAVNFIVAGIFLIAGTDGCIRDRMWWKKVRQYFLKPLVLIIYFFSIISWGNIYASSVKHVNDVHRTAGEWLRDSFPQNTVLAVFDVGAIKYFSQLPVVDIAGLTDLEVLQYVLAGDVIPIMRERGAEYLVMIEEPAKPKKGLTDAPELYHSDFYERLGIIREIGRSIELRPVKRFAISQELWFRHWVALRTHSPVIMVYKIEWLNRVRGEEFNYGSGKGLGEQNEGSRKNYFSIIE